MRLEDILDANEQISLPNSEVNVARGLAIVRICALLPSCRLRFCPDPSANIREYT